MDFYGFMNIMINTDGFVINTATTTPHYEKKAEKVRALKFSFLI